MLDVLTYTGATGDAQRYGKLSRPDVAPGGRALWFVPGLGGSIKGALHFLEHLLPAFDAIYGADLRGFGLNPLPEPLQEATIIQRDLEAFYQQVIAPAGHRELVLCGISLGGVLSTLLATQAPEARFSRLILIAPAYKPHAKYFTPLYTLKSLLAYVTLGKKARTQLPYGLEALTRNPAILADPQYAEAPPLILTPGFLLSVRDLSLKALNDLQTLTLPACVIVPGQDVVCDPVAMRAGFARIPASTPKTLLEYPDLFHDVLFEAEHPQIAQELLAWLVPDAAWASRSASLSS